MSYLDRTISDAIAPATSGAPVRRSAGAQDQELDASSESRVPAGPVEEESPQASPLRANVSRAEPSSDETPDEDQSTTDAQPLRRVPAPSVDASEQAEAGEEESLQRKLTSLNPARETAPMPGDHSAAPGAPLDLRMPPRSRMPSSFQRQPGEPAQAGSPIADPEWHRSSETAPVSPASEHGGGVHFPRERLGPDGRVLDNLSEQTNHEPGPARPLIPLLAVPDHADAAAARVIVPEEASPQQVTPAGHPVHPRPRLSASSDRVSETHGPTIEIGRLEIIVEAPATPAVMPMSSPPLPMPGAAVRRPMRRL